MQRIAGAGQSYVPAKQPEVARAVTVTATATHDSPTQKPAPKQNMPNSPVPGGEQPVQRKRKASFLAQESVEETRNAQSDDGSEYEPDEVTAKRRKTVKKIAKNKRHGTCGDNTNSQNDKKARGLSKTASGMDALRSAEERQDMDESRAMTGVEVMQVSHLLNTAGGSIGERNQVSAPLAYVRPIRCVAGTDILLD
jgi:hypothetical protein